VAVPDSLQKLLEDGVIDDIKTRLMSGKEATVYVVERQGELIAAKIYKSREQRTFKATASYTEGRNQTRNTRDKRAMGKRTAYGKELVEKSWRDMEYQALSDAWHAGVRVPEPILLYEDVLLMQLLVDEQGNPAPRLADFEIPADVAELLHREIYGQVRLLLASGKVHGDLSAFNILIAADGPTIIDMPQVVDASGNQSAAEILRRDLANVTEHLAKFDARLLRFRDCGLPLWRHYERGTLDSALDPEEGTIRSEANHRSKRVRDAERGRMGREPGRFARPGFDDRGPPPARDRGPPPPADRGPPPRERPPFHNDRGPPPPADRGPPPRERPPFQNDRGPPPPLAGPPPRDRPPFRDDRGPPPRDDRGPPPRERPPFHNDRGPPPPRDDRGPPRDRPPFHNDRGPPPPRDDRGPPPRDRPPFRDDRGPPRDDRGAPPRERPPFHNDRGPPPPRDDRGPPPRDRPPFRDDRGPPPRDDRGPPRDRPPFRDDRGPPPPREPFHDRGREPINDRPPFAGDSRPPPRRRPPPPTIERRPARPDDTRE
jgi:RIO kinase 1